ncbi:MAG TPA: lipid-A-disaccharide synthase [Bacteroidales bacterium]|nr:lipid-A-disaccharide synthase [Bacteroidales bacterium]
MKYYIISGESSGDLHGANLMKYIKKYDNNATFRIWGGNLMLNEGGTLVKHYKDLAFMGFTEVITHIFTIIKNFLFCIKDIVSFKPDAVILIDYPGFNLKIAKFAKKKGFKVFYYISPQIWAWKQSRIKIIRKYVDRMFVILPFEKNFYESFDVEVDFVGHPLLDVMNDSLNNQSLNKKNENIIAILPGSRKQEINNMLPIMLKITKNFPNKQFIVAGVSSVNNKIYDIIHKYKNVSIEYDNITNILLKAQAAIVTSGTATLQTALFEVPQIVCYKGSLISYYLAKKFIKVKYISLVNLIMNKPVIKELIQYDFNVNNLTNLLSELLYNQQTREQIKHNYIELKEKLGHSGASQKTAKLIFERLKNSANA